MPSCTQRGLAPVSAGWDAALVAADRRSGTRGRQVGVCDLLLWMTIVAPLLAMERDPRAAAGLLLVPAAYTAACWAGLRRRGTFLRCKRLAALFLERCATLVCLLLLGMTGMYIHVILLLNVAGPFIARFGPEVASALQVAQPLLCGWLVCVVGGLLLFPLWRKHFGTVDDLIHAWDDAAARHERSC